MATVRCWKRNRSMSIRTLTIGLLAVAAAAFAQPPGRGLPPNWGPRLVGAEAGRQGPVVKGAPFSADLITESTQALADGNHIHQTSTSRLYRDGEGRTRREQSLDSLGVLGPNANLPPVGFIKWPVCHVNYALSPSAHTATRAAGAGRRMRVPQAQTGGAGPKTETPGHPANQGKPTQGPRPPVTIGAGQLGNEQPIQIGTETWYSADLQMAILSRRTDPRSGETVTRYANISRAEPPHALFEVPADYKVTDAGGGGPRNRAKESNRK